MAKNKGKNKQITAGGSMNQQPGQTIILTAPKRGGVDIGYYMQAIKNAEHIDKPKRVKLLDLYTDIMIDTHLKSVMRTHIASILKTPIQFQRDGVVDEKVQEHLESPWFSKFCEDVIKDEWEGVGGSLFQFFRNPDGWLNYKLIPRKHVDAVNRIIYKRQTDETGVSWDEYRDTLFVGEPRQIGELAAVAFWVILKRNDVGDWAQFAEIFGQPIREGTYNAWDEDARQRLINDITALGSSPVYIHPEGTNIRLIESSQKSGSADVFEGLAKFCNAEISKAVKGGTLTTEAGEKGTQALGTVQKEGEKDISFFIERKLLNVLNYEVGDLLANFGINTAGGKFVFAPPKTTDLKEELEIDDGLVNKIGLPLSDDYFYEKYNRPKPDNYEELKAEMRQRQAPVFGLSGLPAQPDQGKTDPAGQPEPEPSPDDPKEPPKKGGGWSVKNLFAGWFPTRQKQGDLRALLNPLYRCAAEDTEQEYKFDQEALKKAIKQIYEGFNVKGEIQPDLFNAIWAVVNDATDKGMNYPKPTDRNFDFCNELKRNNAVFAAFKTHRMQNDIALQLTDGKGILKPFRQWQADVLPLVDHYVDHWQRTEYDTAVIRAHQAADWKQFLREADVLPNLEWCESLSVTPGADHKIYWNLILPISHPFWGKHKPGDRWGCKCSLRNTDKTRTAEEMIPGDSSEWTPAPGLGGNPAETGQIFSDDHPYFTEAHPGAGKAVEGLIKSLSQQ